MRIGSLFSGIGGLELGLERVTGARVAWQVELDPFCRRVLERHWPHARRFDDIRTVGAHNLEPVDIICGGFPCQDLSVAGRGTGLDGGRSGLFFELMRVVREIRPRYVFMENVTALLARGLGRVLGELAACGYDARWDCVPASSVGAPHQRDRIFILAADAERGGLREQPIAIAWSDGRTVAPGDGAERDASRARLERGGQGLPSFGDWCGWQPASAVRRVDDGAAEGVDRPRRRRPVNDKPRLRALGNAVVPQAAARAWLTLTGAR